MMYLDETGTQWLSNTLQTTDRLKQLNLQFVI